MKKNKLSVYLSVDHCESTATCCGIYELGGFVITNVHDGRQPRGGDYEKPSAASLKLTARELVRTFADCGGRSDRIGLGTSRKTKEGVLITCSVISGPAGSYWWFIKRSLIMLGFEEVGTFVNIGSGNKLVVLHMLLNKGVYDALIKRAIHLSTTG